MSDLKLAMTLTLADGASGPLRGFTDLVERLGSIASGVAAKLDAITASINGMGKASAGAASVGALTADLGRLDAISASVAAVMGTLGAAVTSMAAQATAAIAGVAGLTAAQTAHNAATQAGGAHLQAQGGQLAAVNQQASGLSSTLKGLALLWGAMKVEKGLKGSVTDAAELQSAEIMLKGLNLGAERTQEILNKSWDDSRALRFISVLDAVKLRMAAIGGLAQTMDDRVIDATLPQATKLANNLRAAGDSTSIENLVRNAYGFVEARGQTSDPAAIKASFDLLQRAFTVTGGKITLHDMEMMIRQFGQGASQLSDDGLYQLISAMDQMKISGGESGGGAGGGGAQRLATAMKMLEAYGMGKKMSKRGTAMFEDAGIMDANGQMKGAGLLANSPMQWIESLLPMILAYVRKYSKTYYQGADVNDPKATAVAIQKFLTSTGVSVTAQQAEGLGLQTDTSARINRQAGQAKNSKGVDDVAGDVGDTWVQKIARAKAALESLGTVIGDKLLKVLGPLVDGFSEFVEWLTKLAKENPAIANLLAIGGAFVSLGLAIAGAKLTLLLFSGVLGTLPGWLSVAGAAVNTFASAVGLAFKRMIPLVAAAFAGFEAGTWLAHLNVGGKEVQEWAADLIGWVVGAFQAGWHKISDIVTSIIPGAHAAALQGAQGDGADPMSMAGGYVAGTMKGLRPRTSSGGFTFRSSEGPGAPKAIGGDKADPYADHPKAGRFAHYDKALDDAKEAYRLMADEDRRAAEVMKRQYDANLISADAYFDAKLLRLQVETAAEIKQLELEKAAYAKEGDKAGVKRAETDIAIKKNGLASGAADIEMERQQARIKLDKEAAEVQRDLMKTSGDRHTAEIQRIQDELAVKLQVLVLNKEIAQEQADSMLARAKAASDYAEQYKQIAAIQEAYAEKLAAIDDQERNGTLPALLAEQQKLDLRKQEAAQLDDLIAKLRVYAVASGNEGAVLTLDKLGTKNQSTKGQLDPSTVTMLKATQSGFEQMFSAVLNGSMSAGKAIEQFAQNLKKSFIDIISKKLGDELFKSLFGGDSASGGSGVGGLFGALAGMVGGLFGGGAANTSLGGGGTQPSIDRMPGFAVGTDYVPYDMVARIHKGERIVTARDNAAGRIGGGYSGPQTIMLQAHPDIMNMRFQDVLDAHVNHAMATR